MSLNDRIGKFSIIRNEGKHDFARWYDAAQCVLETCVVVSAEAITTHNTIEYYAISSQFDEVSDGDEVPEYIAVIDSTDNHPTFVRFERK